MRKTLICTTVVLWLIMLAVGIAELALVMRGETTANAQGGMICIRDMVVVPCPDVVPAVTFPEHLLDDVDVLQVLGFDAEPAADERRGRLAVEFSRRLARSWSEVGRIFAAEANRIYFPRHLARVTAAHPGATGSAADWRRAASLALLRELVEDSAKLSIRRSAGGGLGEATYGLRGPQLLTWLYPRVAEVGGPLDMAALYEPTGATLAPDVGRPDPEFEAFKAAVTNPGTD